MPAIAGAAASYKSWLTTGSMNYQVKPSTSDSPPADSGPFGTITPTGYKWNLPPHNWSLPVRPQEVQSIVGPANAFFEGPTGINKSSVLPDELRRGRMWFFNSAGEISKVGQSKDPATVAKNAAQLKKDMAAFTWGFQFLWNPNSINYSVAMNMDFTPGTGDIFKGVAGAYPSQESVNFTLTLDRTNDFACFSKTDNITSNEVSTYYGKSFTGADEVSRTPTTKLKQLLSQGTMADLEYLFASQNGYSSGDTFYANLLGRKTADVGYLIPNLVAMQLGPDENSMSYVGYMNNISINHTAFTQKMIPIRTEVTIQFACFSGSGLGTSG